MYHGVQGMFVVTLLYPLTITATKISILLFYRRIFTVPKFRLATSIVGTCCVLWCLIAVGADLFQCRPISAAWTPAFAFKDPPVCINSGPLFWVFAIILFFTDIAILCLPLSMVWRLQLSALQKLILSGIFMLGSL